MKFPYLALPFLILLIVLCFSKAANSQSRIVLNSLKQLNDSISIDNRSSIQFKALSLPDNHVYEVDYNPLKTRINKNVLWGVGGVTLLTGIGVDIYQRNAWWKNERTSFHFQNDWAYALWIDKVGHFYAAGLLSHLFASGFEAANFQSDQCAIYGSLSSFLFQMYVEIEDGFGADWGFSPGDATADFLGSAYSLAQYYHPFLKNFQFKFSYYPSLKMREGLHPGNGIDDYEGQKYWMSVRIKNLLPESIARYWPSFLNLALGMSVKNLGSLNAYREYYLAFDLDAEAIPLYGKWWEFFKNGFNYLHIPLPGIRISPNFASFVFCF
jgi:Predicted periplasmic lipoprotein (DUF2279)